MAVSTGHGRAVRYSSRLAAIKEARRLADSMWRECGQADAGVIDPLGLVRYLNSDLMFANLNRPEVKPKGKTRISGAVFRPKEAEVATIAIEAGDEVVRQRFSIVHESAHLMLAEPNSVVDEVRQPYHRPRSDRRYFRTKPGEYFADLVAHMFLMPTGAVVAALNAGWSTEKMADSFKVSITSMRRRLYYLSLEAKLDRVAA